MARASAQRWTARLLAAVTSLVLVLASMLGAVAHAGETGHHGQHRHQDHAGGVHVHHHGAAARTISDHGPDAIVVAATQDKSGAAASASDHPGDQPESGAPDRAHAGCMDFICHGCIAIVAGETGSRFTPWHEARVLPWDARALASVSPTRLDRPPKAPVSA